MIYQIRNDTTGALVYDPRIPEAVVVSPKLRQPDNAMGSLRFTMYPNHPEFSGIAKRRTVYAVYRGDALNPVWKGICVEGADDQGRVTDFYFEDFLSVLRDSMQDPFTWQGPPEDFFTGLLTAHNAQVETWQQIRVGHMTVTDPNNYIYRSSETELSTWEIIKTRLLDLMGGHLRLRYEGGEAYLDYLAGGTGELDPYLHTSTQTIELGENLRTFSRTVTAADTYSACIPKGAEMEFYDDDGAAYRARLTVESVNEGSKYLVNSSAVALYGWRCAPLDLTTWDDVTVPENLIQKGREFLNGTLVKLSNTLKLSAADLCHLGVAGECLGHLDYVPVSVSTVGINQIYLLTDLEIPLDDPAEVTVQLGETTLSLSDQQARNAAQAAQRLGDVERAVGGMQYQVQGEIAEVTESLQTLIQQTGDAILTECQSLYATATSMEEFREQFATAMEQTAQSFTFQFQQLTSQITTLDGSTTQRFQNLNKYIRFVNGKIIIGVDGNPLILELRNDRICFLANDVEIAYFSAGRLYVDQLEALTSLTLGRYAFLPDKEGGMTLKYIGT